MKKYQISLGEKKIIKDQGLLQFEEIKNLIRILPELEQLIPPLLEDEFRQLEQNIIREGCREALLIWQTTEDNINPETQNTDTVFVLFDGHNRYSICKKHGMDFKIHLVDFKSLYDVRQYMIDNQLGRRNLTSEQVSYLRGMKYLNEKKEKGKEGAENTVSMLVQNKTSPNICCLPNLDIDQFLRYFKPKPPIQAGFGFFTAMLQPIIPVV